MSGPEDYDYELPEGRIATRPIRPRDAARLLLMRRDDPGSEIEHRQVRDLPEILTAGDRLVINETKVIPARLRGRVLRSNREIEVLLVRESSPGRWIAWVGPMRALQENDRILFHGAGTIASFEGREGEAALLSFDGDVSSLIGARGHVPLPPYIGREDTPEDREDYQTIFARVPGAIAAPTAGLHFTSDLLARLVEKGIGITRVTLHVGPGTFRPLRCTDLGDHRVEPEYFSISAVAAGEIAETKAKGGRIVAVGTTSVRAIETWAETVDAFTSPAALEGWTDLTIVPPRVFRGVDCLMTNFHLPRSSLLVLVCAFAGRERVLNAYAEAVSEGYRFYSYGDAMLIL
jgi:S-adenosylmethionine:tRNA ribosyltransferase-isomerase